MPRQSSKVKSRISITVGPDLLKWVKAHVGPGQPFGSVSHAFESGIVALMGGAKQRDKT